MTSYFKSVDLSLPAMVFLSSNTGVAAVLCAMYISSQDLSILISDKTRRPKHRMFCNTHSFTLGCINTVFYWHSRRIQKRFSFASRTEFQIFHIGYYINYNLNLLTINVINKSYGHEGFFSY